ncbi:hypothetical protein PM082_007009 [Marasmius tenuissimus]|nr:hypothetical protein PM082_007009 [Marasmius tenuissimus]
MSRRNSSFCSAENAQPSYSDSELVRLGRDHNVNNGFGNFTVNNDNRVTQQKNSIRWHIRGTEEEEEEYDQYNEYRRGDIRLFQQICFEKLDKWDQRACRHVPSDCEQSVFLGEVLSGEGKGTIVTVVSHQGQDAPEKWKNSFQRHSEHLCASSAHLLGLNRSKIPQLILLGGLVPAAVFTENIGDLGRGYLRGLSMRWNCEGEELWMDDATGVICRGPAGPRPGLTWWGFGKEDLWDPVTTSDLLQEDVLLRYLASLKRRGIDRMFVLDMHLARHNNALEPVDKVDRPTVFDTLTSTPIAVANDYFWQWKSSSFADLGILENEWYRKTVHRKFRKFGTIYGKGTLGAG